MVLSPQQYHQRCPAPQRPAAPGNARWPHTARPAALCRSNAASSAAPLEQLQQLLQQQDVPGAADLLQRQARHLRSPSSRDWPRLLASMRQLGSALSASSTKPALGTSGSNSVESFRARLQAAAAGQQHGAGTSSSAPVQKGPGVDAQPAGSAAAAPPSPWSVQRCTALVVLGLGSLSAAAGSGEAPPPLARQAGCRG